MSPVVLYEVLVRPIADRKRTPYPSGYYDATSVTGDNVNHAGGAFRGPRYCMLGQTLPQLSPQSLLVTYSVTCFGTPNKASDCLASTWTEQHQCRLCPQPRRKQGGPTMMRPKYRQEQPQTTTTRKNHPFRNLQLPTSFLHGRHSQPHSVVLVIQGECFVSLAVKVGHLPS